MKKSILALSIAAALLAMSGCSSFKVGAACYIPHGVSGQCTAATKEPGTQPAAAPVAPQPVAIPKSPGTGT